MEGTDWIPNTRRNKELTTFHHQEGANSNIQITNILNNMWLIPSFTNINKVYVVEKNKDCKECYERCESCNICSHTFSCTCPDFVPETIICKHIHKVAWETVDERLSDSDSDNRSTGSWAKLVWKRGTPVERSHDRSMDARVKVRKVSESKWCVPSFTDPDILYTVECNVTSNVTVNCCQCKRKDRCYPCNICVHSYTCTCPDYNENFSICKHIHKVASLENINISTIDEL